MKMRAMIKRATKHYQAYYGTITNDPLEVIMTQKVPCPAYIEIVDEVERGVKYYLILYYDKNGGFLTDSWCQTLEEAKDEARLEFNVSDDDWEIIAP